jgi:hypothetical protein
MLCIGICRALWLIDLEGVLCDHFAEPKIGTSCNRRSSFLDFVHCLRRWRCMHAILLPRSVQIVVIVVGKFVCLLVSDEI